MYEITKLMYFLKISTRDFKKSIPLIFSITIFLAVVVSLVITIDSTSTELFEGTKEEIRQYSDPHLSFGKTYDFNFSLDPFTETDKLITQFNNVFISNQFDKYIETHYKGYDMLIDINNSSISNNNSYSGQIAYYTETNHQRILQQMVNQSQLPMNSNETIIIIKEPLDSIFQLNSSVNITMDYYNYVPTSPFPLKIVGILIIKTEDYFLNSIQGDGTKAIVFPYKKF
ncbi:MAG: hypothetical protein ACFE96_16785 [Candidatus Hermodarchaeota archaeon]